jgi:hypothetical protein
MAAKHSDTPKIVVMEGYCVLSTGRICGTRVWDFILFHFSFHFYSLSFFASSSLSAIQPAENVGEIMELGSGGQGEAGLTPPTLPLGKWRRLRGGLFSSGHNPDNVRTQPSSPAFRRPSQGWHYYVEDVLSRGLQFIIIFISGYGKNSVYYFSGPFVLRGGNYRII